MGEQLVVPAGLPFDLYLSEVDLDEGNGFRGLGEVALVGFQGLGGAGQVNVAIGVVERGELGRHFGFGLEGLPLGGCEELVDFCVGVGGCWSGHCGCSVLGFLLFVGYLPLRFR